MEQSMQWGKVGGVHPWGTRGGGGWSYIKQYWVLREEEGTRRKPLFCEGSERASLCGCLYFFQCVFSLPPSQSVSASLGWGLCVLKGHPSGLSEVGVLQVRQEFGGGEQVGGTCGGTEVASPLVSQHILRPVPHSLRKKSTTGLKQATCHTNTHTETHTPTDTLAMLHTTHKTGTHRHRKSRGCNLKTTSSFFKDNSRSRAQDRL